MLRSLLLASAAAFVLLGCGGSEDAAAPPETTTATSTQAAPPAEEGLLAVWNDLEGGELFYEFPVLVPALGDLAAVEVVVAGDPVDPGGEVFEE